MDRFYHDSITIDYKAFGVFLDRYTHAAYISKTFSTVENLTFHAVIRIRVNFPASVARQRVVRLWAS
jgi:hypothetical protein